MLKRYALSIATLLLAFVLASCNVAAPLTQSAAPATDAATPATPQSPVSAQPVPGAVAALQDTLEHIYAQVNPSVVTVRVIERQQVNVPLFPQIPGFPSFGGPSQPQTQIQQALGSGFVWDKEGDIVTNNHVVAGATNINVTFYDGRTVSAKLVGADPDSDLAVIKVNVPATELHPVELANSAQVKVGQLAIAIGNPFGEQNTMTMGIISALGRSLPVGSGNGQGPTYTIPDVIQTDTPINPGNSGGVLLDDTGRVIGVTSAIESPVRASSGIGFVIPSTIVQQVVPTLIKTGHFEHPYIGISGASLTPALAQEMGLKSDQQGALVVDVVPGGPADKAGLQGSSRQVTIQGQQARVGGDVITAINGQPVKNFGDLTAYLALNTQVGQTVTLTILRQGKEETVQVTLATRPSSTPQAAQGNSASGGIQLGVTGTAITPEIAKAMNLPSEQKGILVEQVTIGSPADKAGLRGSYKPVDINGRRVLVGGDVIVAVGGQTVASMSDLQTFLHQAQSGQQVTFTLVRDGKQVKVEVTLSKAASQ